MAVPRSLSEINELIAGGLPFPKTRLAVTIAQFSSNEQLNYVYRACAFRRGKNDERMCWKSVERHQGYSSMRRLSLDADHLPKYTVFQAGTEFLEVSPTEFASLPAIEKSSFLDKKSKEVAGDWEVCIESRPKDQFKDAKVTYFSRFLNCIDNLPGVYEVEQKFLEQVTVSEPAVSRFDTHLVATAELAVQAIQECRGRIDVSLGLFHSICEEVRSIQTEIAEVNVVIADTERAVQDILSLLESHS
ncbi:hypothetical protein R1sor_011373 [Riccia sorocarpa]|uniref:Uncharacterized protein n=1 Tax=Riccia sorocarpa TaxID=122646 RepID=A0ABD3I3F8_9MARC